MTEAEWIDYGNDCGWMPPRKAALFYRLPVVRWFRHLWLAFNVERHYGFWNSIGFARSGYDNWVLFGIFHGFV